MRYPPIFLCLAVLLLSLAACAAAEPPLRAEWAQETVLPAGTEEFVLDTDEYAARILLQTDAPVSDFRLFALSLTDMDDSGCLIFSARKRLVLPVFAPERPLLIALTFPGDLPSFGISYIDPDGLPRRFTLEISGEDGALLLVPAEGTVWSMEGETP